MKQLYKFSSIFFLKGVGVAVIFCTLTWKTAGAGTISYRFFTILTSIADTTPIQRLDSSQARIISPTDTIPSRIDTSLSRQRIDTFSLKISKDSLAAPLRYSAEDSVVVLVKDKKIILYGKTRTEYTDIILTAPKVEFDQQTQVLTAVNRKDSTGEIIEVAHFKNATNEFTSDTIRYNFKTQVGLTQHTYTQEGEIFVIGEVAKKVNENTTYIKNARFTTCNLDEPHFAFLTGKLKVINNKVAVSGPAHPEFEGVPVPIYLPFGFYPLKQGQHSGFLPPQFSSNEQYGLGLEGIGFYKVLSPYWDFKVYGNIYSYGGWSANLNPSYRKRYRYSGAFNIAIQTTKLNFKGDPDYLKNRSIFLTWGHSVDSRARPGTSFSANVNAGSTRFNQLIPNNPTRNYQNQLGSSIAYSKTWRGKPYSLTITANHNQNNTTRLINLNLPDVGFTVNTIYPFEKKEFVGTPKWFEKVGVGYNGSFRNQVSFYDTALQLKQLIDTLQWGAQHSFPLTMALPPFFNGAIILSPSVSYSQIWIAQKFRRRWNNTTQKLDTIVHKGFFMDHQLSFGVGLNTALYGTYRFKGKRLLAIRHVIRPSIGFNYKPDLSKGHFYSEQVDNTGYKFRFSEFDGSLYGYYPEGKGGGMNFQLDNNLAMKWRSRKDSGENAIKRITLIEGFGLSTGYNFLRDSMKLDLIQLYMRTTLFGKLSISGSAVLDPYQTDSRGRDIDRFVWQDGKFRFGRITTGSISASTSFQSKPRDPKKDEENKKLVKERLNDPALIGEQQRLLDYMRQNPSEFVDFNIPWQVSLNYSLYFHEVLKPDYSGFTKEFSSNLSFNGSFNLTPKWNFSMNGYYDFKTKNLQTFQLGINREMHCWQLSIQVTPVGPYRSFSFSLSPKASILQDLRINRTRFFKN